MISCLVSLIAFLCSFAEPPPLATSRAIAVHSPSAVSVAIDDPVVWSELTADGIVIALHVSGTFTATALDDVSGVLQLSTSAATQGPAVTGGGGPTLTTTWTDASGVTHTVSTPLAGDTQGIVDKAIATHRALVARMQGIFPPRPITPP